MSGDQPGRNHEPSTAPGSVDFLSIIQRGTTGRQEVPATHPEVNQPGYRPGGTSSDVVRIGTDASNTVDIVNKTVELSFKDPNFDNKMMYAATHGADKFNKIKIDDLPSNYVVHTWMDRNGYFLWYDDGTRGPKDRHYLPNNAMSLEANTMHLDLERERINDNQQFAKNNFGGFRNFDRSFVPASDGTTNSTSYYWKIAGATPEALAVQEHALRESVRSSANPYFKIYLSDIEAAQALQPLRERAAQGLPFNPNNEYTRGKIDTALSLSKAAFEQTNSALGQVGQYPTLNVYLPLAPQRPFWDYKNKADDYIGFWGGGYNQSYGRQQNLTSLRGLIMSGVVPRVHDLPEQR
jgi:hypothetical protein